MCDCSGLIVRALDIVLSTNLGSGDGVRPRAHCLLRISLVSPLSLVSIFYLLFLTVTDSI